MNKINNGREEAIFVTYIRKLYTNEMLTMAIFLQRIFIFAILWRKTLVIFKGVLARIHCNTLAFYVTKIAISFKLMIPKNVNVVFMNDFGYMGLFSLLNFNDEIPRIL